MIDQSYLLGRGRIASPLTRWIDQRLVPAAINAAAPFEHALYRASSGARAWPVLALCGALVLGFAARTALSHEPARARRRR